MRCTGTVWEGDSFARAFSDQARAELRQGRQASKEALNVLFDTGILGE